MLKLSASLLGAVAMAQQHLSMYETNSQNLFAEDDSQPLKQTLSKNGFGCMVEESVYSHPRVEKTIKAPLVPFSQDPAQ